MRSSNRLSAMLVFLFIVAITSSTPTTTPPRPTDLPSPAADLEASENSTTVSPEVVHYRYCAAVAGGLYKDLNAFTDSFSRMKENDRVVRNFYMLQECPKAMECFDVVINFMPEKVREKPRRMKKLSEGYCSILSLRNTHFFKCTAAMGLRRGSVFESVQFHVKHPDYLQKCRAADDQLLRIRKTIHKKCGKQAQVDIGEHEELIRRMFCKVLEDTNELE